MNSLELGKVHSLFHLLAPFSACVLKHSVLDIRPILPTVTPERCLCENLVFVVYFSMPRVNIVHFCRFIQCFGQWIAEGCCPQWKTYNSDKLWERVWKISSRKKRSQVWICPHTTTLVLNLKILHGKGDVRSFTTCCTFNLSMKLELPLTCMCRTTMLSIRLL